MELPKYFNGPTITQFRTADFAVLLSAGIFFKIGIIS